MTTPIRKILALTFAALFALAMACGGENANTTDNKDSNQQFWTVQGQLTESEMAGGTAMALSEQGEVEQAKIKSDRSFELDLEGERSYMLNFLENGSFKAVMFYQQKSWSGKTTNLIRLPAKTQTRDQKLEHGSRSDEASNSEKRSDNAQNEGRIEMGNVDLENGRATPEHPPTTQIDTDGDGTVDSEDDDANGNGTPDNLEADEADIDSSELGLIVASVEPSPGEDDADTTEKVEVEFNQPVDPETVTADAVALTTQDGTAIETAIATSRGNEEIKLLPKGKLDLDTSYTVKVDTSIQTEDGTALATPFESSFRTEAEEANDNADQFRLEKVDPGAGAQDAAADVRVEAKFNQTLDASTTAGSGKFELLNQQREPVSGTLEVENDELTFTPDELLDAGSKYQAIFGPDLESGDGDTFDHKRVITFFVEGDRGNNARDEHRPDAGSRGDDAGEQHRPEDAGSQGDDAGEQQPEDAGSQGDDAGEQQPEDATDGDPEPDTSTDENSDGTDEDATSQSDDATDEDETATDSDSSDEQTDEDASSGQ